MSNTTEFELEPIGKHERGLLYRLSLFLNGIRIFKDWHVWLGEHFGFRMKHGSFRLRNGTVYFINPSEGDAVAAFQEIYLQKRYTRYYTPKGTDCVIDVGAAVGEFAIFAASLSPHIRAYAFEPEPRPFKRLKAAIEANGMQDRVSAFRLAVADKKGEITIENRGNIFWDDTSIKAAATTLEDIFHDHKITQCQFLKVDIEGAEFEVLMNTPRHIFEKISHIALEYHRAPRELIMFLKQNGYVVNAFASGNQCGYIYASR